MANSLNPMAMPDSMSPGPSASPNPTALPPQGPGRQSPSPFADVHQSVKQAHNNYRETLRAQKVLDHIRTERDKLMEMGDVVRPEHVVESAGRLVGHGLGAQQLATLLADMPTVGGQGLASWVRMHNIQVTMAEAALARENAVAQHNLAVAGLASLGATDLEAIQHHMSQATMGQQLGNEAGTGA